MEEKEKIGYRSAEKRLFDTVYQWGRVGIITDENCETFKELIQEIKENAVGSYQNEIFEDIKNVHYDLSPEGAEGGCEICEMKENIISIIEKKSATK